jgi:insulysin
MEAHEEHSDNATPAGLYYKVSLNILDLFLDLSGYSDKLAVLLQQVFRHHPRH